MAKQKERYKAWGKAYLKAWVTGDVEAVMACWAPDCIHVAVDPFGDHRTTQNREAIRRLYEAKSANFINKKLLKSEVLSANKERGIFHNWVSWTAKDGRKWACNYISIIYLDKHDLCTNYMEWDVVKFKEPSHP